MKRTFIKISALCLALLMTLSLVACSAGDTKNNYKGNNASPWENYPGKDNSSITDPEKGNPGEENNRPTFWENPFISTAETAISTFSADVDTASYSYFRKLVKQNYTLSQLQNNGYLFRTEEFLNYFDYTTVDPEGDDLFGMTSSVVPCPWNEESYLLTMTLQTSRMDTGTRPPNNLVFLIDVSGSMQSSDKLPLLKKAFATLVASLSPMDKISIVTYSGRESIVLSGASGNEGDKIMNAINSLKAGGSTNGQAGLEKAYQVAEANRIEGGNNRIIMASDGDLNVGISSQAELKTFIEGKRNQGVYLSVLGFGTGNYQDSKMETIAQYGSGVYYYIDGEEEAEKVFGTDLCSTIWTVADDVKLQFAFNPEIVGAFRLIGYENRVMDEDDFRDDTKDAAEIGMFHQVTVAYELKLTQAATVISSIPNYGTLSVRYKKPGESMSLLNEHVVGGESAMNPHTSSDQVFMQAVIETCMLLHNSKYWVDAPESDARLDAIIAKLEALNLPEGSEQNDFMHLLITLRYNTHHRR